MARMIAEVYDALRSAGADEDKARAAAIALDDQFQMEQLGQRLEGQIAGTEDRLGARIDRVEHRLDQMEQRLDRGEQRLDGVERRLGQVEQRLDGVEQRLVRVERDAFVIKWMMGFLLTLQVASFFMLWQIVIRLPS